MITDSETRQIKVIVDDALEIHLKRKAAAHRVMLTTNSPWAFRFFRTTTQRLTRTQAEAELRGR